MSLATTSLCPRPLHSLFRPVWRESAPLTPQSLTAPPPALSIAAPGSALPTSSCQHYRAPNGPAPPCFLANGCLFKHWSCLHCCGSLHVKHSPVKPYANPIKVSAVQCGEAITIGSQVCLLSSRKGNLIEQLKGKSDSAQHHVDDTRLNCSWSVEGRGNQWQLGRAATHR